MREMSGLERNTVHQSLVRNPLFAGVEFGLLVMEIAIGVAILFVGNFTLWSVVPGVVIVLAIHIPMKRMLDRDPQFIPILASSLHHRTYYAPVSDIRTPLPKPHASISTRS